MQFYIGTPGWSYTSWQGITLTQEIKEKIKERYGKIALSGNTESCCMPGSVCCDTEASAEQALLTVGYNKKELESIPQSSLLGVGCGAPLNFAQLKEGETVVDLGSGAGIDVFLASKQVKDSGKGKNVEFRKGDIESKIPVEDHSVDIVISNCVINLTTDKVKAFKEIYRILKKGGEGRIAISDLVTSKEVHGEGVNPDKWCSCVDGAITRENYIYSIKEAGFKDVKVLSEQVYMDETQTDGRKITSTVIGAVT